MVEFKNKKGESFTLGIITFNLLEKNNVFDRYKEQTNNPDIIFKCNDENAKKLSDDVWEILLQNTKLYSEYRNKLAFFCKFLIESEGVIAKKK